MYLGLPNNRILSSSEDRTFRVWDAETGTRLAVIPFSEMDVTGMDMSAAKLDPDLARLLYYNGATIHPADAACLPKKQLNL